MSDVSVFVSAHLLSVSCAVSRPGGPRGHQRGQDRVGPQPATAGQTDGPARQRESLNQSYHDLLC